MVHEMNSKEWDLRKRLHLAKDMFELHTELEYPTARWWQKQVQVLTIRLRKLENKFNEKRS